MNLLLVILISAFVYFIFIPLLNGFLMGLSRIYAANKIDEYAKLVKLDVFEHGILHRIFTNDSSLDDIKKRYINLTEVELNEILGKYYDLKVLDFKRIRYFLKADKYLSLDMPNLSKWESKVLFSFWCESGSHSLTYKQLLQEFTGVTEERVVNALKSLCNVGVVIMLEDGNYELDMREIYKGVRLHRRAKEYQNNE